MNVNLVFQCSPSIVSRINMYQFSDYIFLSKTAGIIKLIILISTKTSLARMKHKILRSTVHFN